MQIVNPPLDGGAREGAAERFRTQLRVIGALLLRELHTRYGRHNVGYLWLILEPLLLASAIGALHSRVHSRFGPGINVVVASLLGYCVFMMLRSIVGRSEGAIEANGSLFYHRRVTILDVLISRAILEMAGTMMAMAILMFFCISVGLTDPPERPLFLLVGILSMLFFSFGMSMFISAVTYENHTAGRLVHPVIYLALPLSCAFYPMTYIPADWRSTLDWVPLVHIFEIVRYGWFYSAKTEYISYGYLFAWIAGSWIVGLLCLSLVRNKMHLR